MDAPRELAQLLERALQLGARGLEEPRARGRVGVELALREPELERQRDEPLLRAVVEVALEPPALAHRHLDEPGPRGLQLLDPRAQLGLEPLVLQLERRRGRRGADEARVVAQRRVVDDGADALGVALDLRDRAPGAMVGQLDAVALVGDVVAGRLAPVDELQRRVTERVRQRRPQARLRIRRVQALDQPAAPAGREYRVRTRPVTNANGRIAKATNPTKLTRPIMSSGTPTVSPAKTRPRQTITVIPVQSIGACARRCGGVAARRRPTRTATVAAATPKPMSDVMTSIASATPGA